MRRSLCSGFGILAAALATISDAAAVDHKRSSIATTFALSECRMVARHPDGNAYRCPGLPGYPAYLAEGDQRTFLSFGSKADKRRAAKQSLGPFNTLFESPGARATVEWRTQQLAGRPVPHATIVRYYMSGAAAKSHVLVVSRISDKDTCHVAYVDASANTNAMAMARRIADEVAPGFDCASEPRVEGKPGLLAE